MKYTLDDIAKSLNLPTDMVERWIRQGRIPVQKIRGEYVFQKKVLVEWARSRNLKFTFRDKADEEGQPPSPESLLFSMKRGGVVYDVPGDNAREILFSAVKGLPLKTDAHKEELFELLLAREDMTSTGIGGGIAIPHPRTPWEREPREPFITTCFPRSPVDFKAVDDKPVFIVFILVSPTVKTHLHLLSRLAFCVRDVPFVQFLKTAPGTDDLFAKIDEFEKQLDSTDKI